MQSSLKQTGSIFVPIKYICLQSVRLITMMTFFHLQESTPLPTKRPSITHAAGARGFGIN